MSPNATSGRHAASPHSLRLLGGFELSDPAARPVDLPTRKARLLLACLALPPGTSHTREKLTGMFWGGRGEEQARGSLRHALVALRAALGADAMRVSRETVELVPGALRIDTDALADAASAGTDPDDEAVQAASRGELLEGLSLASDDVTEWLTFERARCRSLAATVLRKSAQALERRGLIGEAIARAQRLVALDPLREQSHRLLMGLFLASGERSQAMAQYQALSRLLLRDLGVEPAAETQQLARSLTEPAVAPSRDAAAASEASGSPDNAATAQGVAVPTEAAPSRFSLAVLPFASTSGDPDKQFIAEGFSADLITELSRLKDFEVIARQSSYQFAGRADKAAEAAAELGARFAVVGSLRRIDNRLRITAQLIDSGGNRCIWAERYDRTVDDLFAVQDEIVRQVVASVDAEIREEERQRAVRAYPLSLDAWGLFHRGLWHAYRFTREDFAIARPLFEQSIAAAPNFALPHGGLAYLDLVSALWFFTAETAASIASGIDHAARGLALDNNSVYCHVVLGRLCVFGGQLERGMHHLRLGLERNPSYAQAHYGLAQALYWSNRPAEALASINTAIRLNPKDPVASMALTMRSFCHYRMGNYVAAAEDARHGTRLRPQETWARLALAVALVELDEIGQARAAVRAALAITPTLSVAAFGRIAQFGTADTPTRAAEALIIAGLPLST